MVSVVNFGPLSQSATSVDVPPISYVIIFSKPHRSASFTDPTTPPAGPDRIILTGSDAA